jgi:hypothetical protein
MSLYNSLHGKAIVGWSHAMAFCDFNFRDQSFHQFSEEKQHA